MYEGNDLGSAGKLQALEALSGMIPPQAPLASLPREMTRISAISQIWAAKADAQIEAVQQFRRDHISETLLEPHAITRWIANIRQQDGNAAPYLVNVPWEAFVRQQDGSYQLPKVWADALMFGRPVYVPQLTEQGVLPLVDTWGKRDERLGLQTKMMWYVAPEWGERSYSEAVRPGGVLDQLRRLSIVLLETYQFWGLDSRRDPRDQRSWGLARAATYVLTGYAPMIEERFYPLRSGKGVHPQSTKHLQLAVFTERHENRTLADRMAEWNEHFPDWSYKQPSTFGWDSRQSLRRLGLAPATSASAKPARKYTAEETAIALEEKRRQSGGHAVAGWAPEIPGLLQDAEARSETILQQTARNESEQKEVDEILAQLRDAHQELAAAKTPEDRTRAQGWIRELEGHLELADQESPAAKAAREANTDKLA